MGSIASGIDHVLFAVPDLEAARAEFESLGFQVTPRGRHERFGTANYLVVFEDAYLELIGVEDVNPVDPAFQRLLAPTIAAGGGVPALALATTDAQATYRGLRTAGIAVTEPVTWSRPADTPDGPRTATFTTMFVDPAAAPGFATFFCQQHTPGHVRHPLWQRHGNGTVGLAGVRRHLSGAAGDAADGWARYLGPQAVETTPAAAVRSTLGPHFIAVDFGASEAACEVELRTRSPGAVRRDRRSADASSTAGVCVALASVHATSLRFVVEQQ
jgi:hypothetical protein